jgi:hypothetical protein
MREDRPHVRGTFKRATRGCPAREEATYTELSGRFRAGQVWAYAWEPREGRWLVWASEADWLATEREGRCRRPDLAELGYGPTVHQPAGPERSRRLTKAELVRRLRALDLPPAALALLDAA